MQEVLKTAMCVHLWKSWAVGKDEKSGCSGDYDEIHCSFQCRRTLTFLFAPYKSGHSSCLAWYFVIYFFGNLRNLCVHNLFAPTGGRGESQYLLGELCQCM